jgi:hypothetical protein
MTMAEGMPKPKMTTVPDAYRKLRNRGEQLDAQMDEAETGTKAPEPKKAEPQKGMPKPGIMDRLKKMVGLN